MTFDRDASLHVFLFLPKSHSIVSRAKFVDVTNDTSLALARGALQAAFLDKLVRKTQVPADLLLL